MNIDRRDARGFDAQKKQSLQRNKNDCS